MQSLNADIEDRDFRLSLIENSNHDGSMIWKIPQFIIRHGTNIRSDPLPYALSIVELLGM